MFTCICHLEGEVDFIFLLYNLHVTRHWSTLVWSLSSDQSLNISYITFLLRCNSSAYIGLSIIIPVLVLRYILSTTGLFYLTQHLHASPDYCYVDIKISSCCHIFMRRFYWRCRNARALSKQTICTNWRVYIYWLFYIYITTELDC